MTGIDDRLRRRVLWSLPTGLYVIGSRGPGPDGAIRRNLMTANLVFQVATEPKLVAAAIDTAALTHLLVGGGRCFSVCLLRREDRAVVRRFVKPVDPETMGDEDVFEAVTGAPILRRSPAWLDCEVREQLDFPSHTLFVGEVVAVGGPPEGEAVGELLRMEDTRMSYGG